MYKENEHETVFANVDTIMFLGSSQVEDREYIQKLLGKTTINQRSTSGSATGSQNISRTPTQTDLMSIDEIAAINMNGRDDEIVVVRDARPMILRKLNLTEHRRWKLVQEAKKKYNIDLRKYYVNTEDKKDIYK
jgi:type IV secretory pathway TraG/TraD family ATPase VirD4